LNGLPDASSILACALLASVTLAPAVAAVLFVGRPIRPMQLAGSAIGFADFME
jgi:drug/metabolite transporter (DMT)-like permease